MSTLRFPAFMSACVASTLTPPLTLQDDSLTMIVDPCTYTHTTHDIHEWSVLSDKFSTCHKYHSLLHCAGPFSLLRVSGQSDKFGSTQNYPIIVDYIVSFNLSFIVKNGLAQAMNTEYTNTISVSQQVRANNPQPATVQMFTIDTINPGRWDDLEVIHVWFVSLCNLNSQCRQVAIC